MTMEQSGAGQPDRKRFAVESALRLLRSRERSASEIRQKLRTKGFDASTIEETVRELQDGGLLSDLRYAESFAREAGERRGYAPAEIRRRLRSKGVPTDVAAEATTLSVEDEEHRARSVARGRAARLQTYPRDVRFRRLSGFLQRRGYSPSVVARVAADLVGGQAEED